MKIVHDDRFIIELLENAQANRNDAVMVRSATTSENAKRHSITIQVLKQGDRSYFHIKRVTPNGDASKSERLVLHMESLAEAVFCYDAVSEAIDRHCEAPEVWTDSLPELLP